MIFIKRRQTGFDLIEFVKETGAKRKDLVDIELGLFTIDILDNNSSRIEKALGLTGGEIKTDYYKRTLGIEK